MESQLIALTQSYDTAVLMAAEQLQGLVEQLDALPASPERREVVGRVLDHQDEVPTRHRSPSTSTPHPSAPPPLLETGGLDSFNIFLLYPLLFSSLTAQLRALLGRLHAWPLIARRAPPLAHKPHPPPAPLWPAPPRWSRDG